MKTGVLLAGVACLLGGLCACALFPEPKTPAWNSDGVNIPIVDLDSRIDLQTVVDREKGQYLGHPTTYLCKDGKTVYCVYPKGHGRGEVVMKRSDDGGKSWSERLPTPKSWESSKEVPTLYGTVGPNGENYVLMFSGIQFSDKNSRNRMAVSKDECKTWSELAPIPNQEGGIVVMADVIALNTGKGHYMATYHNNAARTDSEGSYRTLELYTVKTVDGGMTWSDPKVIFPGTRKLHLCEGGFVRSPDGRTIAILLRENSKNNNSQIMFSNDEGERWSAPRPLPGSLCGDRHQATVLPDGRLLIQFRDISPWTKPTRVESPTEGDWVGWVGTWDDLINGYEGAYRIRFKDNLNGGDTAYPAAKVLPDGTILCVTYGHFDKGETAYILAEHLNIEQTDKLADEIRRNGQPKMLNDMGRHGGMRIFDPNDPEAINKAIQKK